MKTKKIFQRLILSCFVIYFFVVASIYLMQDRFIYHPKHLDLNYEFNFSADFREKFLDSKTGFNINYLIFKHPNPQSVILYFHGNATALDSWGEPAAKLAQFTKSEVWIMDYPGFGKSGLDFARSGQQLVQIGKEFVDLIRKKYPRLPLVLYGRSLGSGIASEVAVKKKIEGLVLETPYLSTVKMARQRMPFVPSFLLKVKLDNAKLAKTHLNHILIFHGTKDKVIPYSQAIQLAQILKGQSQLISVPEAGHDNISTYESYWTALSDFFSSYSKGI